MNHESTSGKRGRLRGTTRGSAGSSVPRRDRGARERWWWWWEGWRWKGGHRGGDRKFRGNREGSVGLFGEAVCWFEGAGRDPRPIGRGAGRSSGGMWDDRLLLGRDPNANEMKNRGPSHPPPHRASRVHCGHRGQRVGGHGDGAEVDLGLSGGAHHRRGGFLHEVAGRATHAAKYPPPHPPPPRGRSLSPVWVGGSRAHGKEKTRRPAICGEAGSQGQDRTRAPKAPLTQRIPPPSPPPRPVPLSVDSDRTRRRARREGTPPPSLHTGRPGRGGARGAPGGASRSPGERRVSPARRGPPARGPGLSGGLPRSRQELQRLQRLARRARRTWRWSGPPPDSQVGPFATGRP